MLNKAIKAFKEKSKQYGSTEDDIVNVVKQNEKAEKLGEVTANDVYWKFMCHTNIGVPGSNYVITPSLYEMFAGLAFQGVAITNMFHYDTAHDRLIGQGDAEALMEFCFMVDTNDFELWMHDCCFEATGKDKRVYFDKIAPTAVNRTRNKYLEACKQYRFGDDQIFQQSLTQYKRMMKECHWKFVQFLATYGYHRTLAVLSMTEIYLDLKDLPQAQTRRATVLAGRKKILYRNKNLVEDLIL